MKAKTLRSRAWNHLNGKWGTVALIAFVYSLLSSVASGLSVIGIGAIALFLVSGPFLYGITIASMSVTRREKTEFNMLFAGFSRFEDSLLLYLLNELFIFLWTLLFVIPGIIKAYSYSMGYFILHDHPELTPNQARKRSIELMKGNKWRLFCLDFSFIGWWILCLLTFGILSFWIGPYHQAARAEFYEDLVNPKSGEMPASNPPAPAPAPAIQTEAAPAETADEPDDAAVEEPEEEEPVSDGYDPDSEGDE